MNQNSFQLHVGYINFNLWILDIWVSVPFTLNWYRHLSFWIGISWD
ncbi:uncharacterized protein OCT59_007352 [Rhizophagus irregularis]|nr:hypothetical protein OCT59_007352 [Rhizophagus irregularis]